MALYVFVIALLADMMSLGASVPRARAAEAVRFGSLRVTVADAKSRAPLPFAGVEIHGGVDRRGLTNAAGVVLFRTLPPGSYALMVTARGHLPHGIRAVVVPANAVRSLTVSLQVFTPSFQQTLRPSRMMTITHVQTPAAVPQARTGEVDDSAISTRISDSILTSLGMLPGVVLQSIGGNINASVGGRSTEQTQTSLDGVQVVGPAQSLGLFSSGIFNTASADLGPSALSFTTPDPTLDWLARLAQIEGDHGIAQTTVSDSGTSGRLGMSFGYSSVSQGAALDGMRYLDASGLDYVHDGLSTGEAFDAKFRYPTSRNNVLLFTYDALRETAPVLCNVYTAEVPCGYGPLDRTRDSLSIAQIRDSWSSGILDGSVSFSSQSDASQQDQSGVFEGVNAPSSSLNSTFSNGAVFFGTVHVTKNYALRGTWQSYDSRSDSSSSGTASSIVPDQYPSNRTSWFSLTAPLAQSRRISSSLTMTGASQLGRASSGVNLVTSYRPTNRDTVSLQYNSGLLGKPTVYRPSLGDPRSMTFDCANHTALGAGPVVEGGDARTSQVELTWTHSGTRFTSQVKVSHAVDRNALVDAVVAAPALDPSLFGPSFAPNLAAAGERACGEGSAYTIDDALFAIAGIAPRAIYDNAQVATQMAIGPNIFTALSAGVSSARAYGTSSPIFSTRSTVIQGRQLPGRPYATATWTFGYGSGHGMLVLLDAHYTSKNNPNALPAYTTFDGSILVPTQHGQLSVAVLNMTNMHPGPFATSADAIPLPMLDGSYRPPGLPLAPRTFEVKYHVAVGKNPESLEAMKPGAGRFIPYNTRDPRAPLGIDRQSLLCGPEMLPDTQALFAAVGAYAKSVQAATVGGEFPATFPDGKFRELRLLYRRNGRSFVILLAQTATSSRAAARRPPAGHLRLRNVSYWDSCPGEARRALHPLMARTYHAIRDGRFLS